MKSTIALSVIASTLSAVAYNWQAEWHAMQIRNAIDDNTRAVEDVKRAIEDAEFQRQLDSGDSSSAGVVYVPVPYKPRAPLANDYEYRPPSLGSIFGQSIGSYIPYNATCNDSDGSIWAEVQPSGERLGLKAFHVGADPATRQVHTIQGTALTSDWGKALSLYNNAQKAIQRGYNISRSGETRKHGASGTMRCLAYDFDCGVNLFVIITRFRRADCKQPIAYDPYKSSKTVYEVMVVATTHGDDYP